MVRKITGMFVTLILFFGLTLNAAAAPITSTPVNNMYTQSHSVMADDDNIATYEQLDFFNVERAWREFTRSLPFQISGLPLGAGEQSLDSYVELIFDY